MHINPEEVLSALNAPPDKVPARAPVETLQPVLPFGDLSWENFERLCCRLAGNEDQIESCSRYGRAGQAQQGIDIYARKRNGRYDVWQAKRYERYSVSKLKSAVTAFQKGSWQDKTECLYIAVQASLADTKIQDEIENQTATLKAQGVNLFALGGDELSELLRKHPDIVHNFFGRAWTKAFFGDEIGSAVLDRLDGEEFARVRSQLGKVYQAGFHLLDRGIIEPLTSFGGTEPPPTIMLLDRFTPPDVLVREARAAVVSPPLEERGQSSAGKQLQDRPELVTKRIEQSRRVPLSSWLAEGEQLALVGDAGTGKSTVLRCIALDILGDQARFPDLSQRWGQRLPLFVSFAKWARDSESANGPVGLKEVIRASLQTLLTANLLGLMDKAIDEGRVLLLVDGLDEWSNEQAARTALQALLTFVGAHEIPTIVTARPRGLSKIGAIPQSWPLGNLAPLSLPQQRELVSKWFARCAGTQPESNSSIFAQVERETDRFFRQLKRDAGLSALAETPLLLVSLIALALRQVTLPRNRVLALKKVIDILIEVHPQSRATASGDVQTRFRYSTAPEVRWGALAKLAFMSRSEGGDAGYLTTKAKKLIRTYLSDPDAHGFTSERADAAANEILAVNAETVGLLVEKGPGEVGFAHASLEEYLAAVHIQNWPLGELLSFVSENASNQRWRNVIANLIAITPRPAEIDQLVEAIESCATDVLGQLNRQLLLADIAFNPSKMSSATAHRLAKDSIAIIEGAGWIGERSRLLASMVNGTHDSALGELVLEKLKVWAPRKHPYFESFFHGLGSWPQAPDIEYTLRRGMFDEERSGQRAAARALATVYKGDKVNGEWLLGLLHGGTELLAASVAIEALTIGWDSIEGLPALIDEARTSVHPSLRVTAIWARVQRGYSDESDLIHLLDLLRQGSELDYWDRSLAEDALLQGWRDNSIAIEYCLKSLNRNSQYQERHIDSDIAMFFLLQCSPDTIVIQNWILKELDLEDPFILGRIQQLWEILFPFANANDKIREQIVKCITSDKSNLLGYKISGVIATLEDVRLKQFALRKAQEDDCWLYFWVRPLIQGWAANDSEVIQLREAILKWPDSKLIELISLLPDIILDREACRSKLLALARAEPEVRHDFLVSAFVQLGCDASDEEVVEVLLTTARSAKKIYNDSDALIANFSAHPHVRALALELLDERDSPTAQIAKAYKMDAQIRQQVLSIAAALTTSLRYIVAEAASLEADRHVSMRRLLERYDWEVDTDLKVTLAIRHYELIKSMNTEQTAVIERLLADAQSVGFDYEERRAAAFAGLVVLKATDRFAPLTTTLTRANEPLPIKISGRLGQDSNVLIQLLINSWDEITVSLGTDFLGRIDKFGLHVRIWEILAPYVSTNESVRRNFVGYCETSEEPLEALALRALSRERPKSDLLESQCLRSLNTQASFPSPLASERAAIEAACLLRDHFNGKQEISKQLHERWQTLQRDEGALALALYDPGHPAFADVGALNFGILYGRWALAVHIAAERRSAVEFIEVLRAMLNRNLRSIWDFQETINTSVRARIIRDEEAAKLVRQVLASEPTVNEVASLPRYLGAVGALDAKAYETCRALLDLHYNRAGVPIAGYDALTDEIRPVTHSLLDALVGTLGS